MDFQDKSFAPYRTIRRTMAYLGLGFLAAVAIYAALRHHVLPTLSHYYFTPVGDILVAVFCSLGVLFAFYRGHDQAHWQVRGICAPWDFLSDRFVARLIAAGAIGTALFPHEPFCVDFDPATGSFVRFADVCEITGFNTPFTQIHFWSAALFISATGIMTSVNFTRGNGSTFNQSAGRFVRDWTNARNRFFGATGLIIFICVALLTLNTASETARNWAAALTGNTQVLILETMAFVSFTLAWLEKGRSKMSPLVMIKSISR